MKKYQFKVTLVYELDRPDADPEQLEIFVKEAKESGNARMIFKLVEEIEGPIEEIKVGE